MENSATDDRADDSQEQIPYQSLAPSVHELTADVAGNKPDDQPRQDTHRISYLALPVRCGGRGREFLQECISPVLVDDTGWPAAGPPFAIDSGKLIATTLFRRGLLSGGAAAGIWRVAIGLCCGA
jgi:hypothetical protein